VHRPHHLESRIACPELVERGRLNLAQDAVLGGHAPMEKSRRDDWKVVMSSFWISGRGAGILNLEYFEIRVPGIASEQFFSRPYGTFRLPNLYPGLRPGLGSAVPVRQAQGRLYGTHFAIARFPTQTLKPSSVGAFYGTAEAVPFVQSFPAACLSRAAQD
jgi:hypothetical protein